MSARSTTPRRATWRSSSSAPSPPRPRWSTGSFPTVGDKFDLETSTDATGAIDRLQNREIAGVIELGPTMNLHIASAEGTMRVQAAEGLAQPLAAAQGVDLNVVDHAPLAADDPTGTGLFYLVMVCTIVGYLTITVLSRWRRACDCVSSSVCWA